MELRPFRCLRYSPRVILERGLGALIAPAAGGGGAEAAAAPENAARLLPSEGDAAREAAAATLASWLSSGVLLRERRPALWIFRRTPAGEPPGPALLVGLVRLGAAPPAGFEGPEAEEPPALSERVAWRRALRVETAPCLLATRAPLSGAMSTNRRPDLTADRPDGSRDDAWRLPEYAQHVELQGLVKNVEVAIVRGRASWEAARAFAGDPDAAKLPGARYQLCAIGEESEPGRIEAADVPAGLFGVALDDPVY